MFIIAVIEKSEVDKMPLLLGALGLFVFFISASETSIGGIGYRGFAFYRYGKRVWKFCNRLFGGLLLAVSLISYLIFKKGDLTTDNKVLFLTISCFLCWLITEVITFILKRWRV
ncbi:hypothetical protein [Enterococcus sp. DIV0756]|uniref:hypothetical protein n=1 Tax=Enterococcus sp. DIV0756 TaxID=2774636 RepID=UPI003F291EF2